MKPTQNMDDGAWKSDDFSDDGECGIPWSIFLLDKPMNTPRVSIMRDGGGLR
jgi:hypothetical protein